jgi:hypothetical protein
LRNQVSSESMSTFGEACACREVLINDRGEPLYLEEEKRGNSSTSLLRVYLELALGFSGSRERELLRVKTERAKLQAFQACCARRRQPEACDVPLSPKFG